VRFDLLGVDPVSGARAGLLHTAHGTIATPAFMPVGTQATVKTLTPGDVRSTGATCILANTYHLVLRPGADAVHRLGGLHGLMRWDGPILTDSGGFQVFSLGGLRQVSDQGVTFQSHLDGMLVFLTPENVIAAEEALGADLIMPLDECVASDASRTATERALERTQRWWERSVAVKRRPDQALFALVQGGMFQDLRAEAARAAVATDPEGFAIGGLSVGEPREQTNSLLQATLAELPRDKPRYLMGVGTPLDLATYAALGVDLFDCVLPTRLARNGTVWLDEQGRRADLARRSQLGLRGPIQADCACVACREWHVGALGALYQAGDPLAFRLMSMHNLTLLGRVLASVRERALCQVNRFSTQPAVAASFTLAEDDAWLGTR
jgi:queuine tRNA-ribosyltransferase